MKKLLVLSSLMLSSMTLCMDFDKEIYSKFHAGLEQMVSAGEDLNDKDQNGAYKIYATLLGAINNIGLQNMLAGEHYKPVVNKHKEIVGELQKNEEYQKALFEAVVATQKMNQAWQDFRKKAAHLATDVLEKEIGMPFSRDHKDDYKLFLERMKNLDREKDSVAIETGVLLWYGFMQMQRNEVKKQCPLLENL